MKLVQTKSYVIETDDDEFKGNKLYLGPYERDICEMINDLLIDEQITKNDLIDIKTTMTSYVVNNIPHLACTVLVIYEKEIDEKGE